MQMLNNLSTTLFLFFSLLNHLAEATFNDESLIFMVENIEKKRSIFLNESTAPTRAFDLWIGNTSETDVSFSNITSTHNSGNGAANYSDIHPTGKWIATAGQLFGFIYDISPANTAFYHLNPQNTISYSTNIQAVKWHPTGNYLTYGGIYENGINGRMVFFNTNTGLQTVMSSNFDIIYGGANSEINAIVWHPNGKYITIAGTGPSNELLVTYSFDAYSLYKIPQASFTSSVITHTIKALGWSADGKYLGIADDNSLLIFYFNEKALTFSKINGASFTRNKEYKCLQWHPYLPIIAAGGTYGAADGETDSFYTFDGTTLTKTFSFIHSTLNNQGNPGATTAVSWSPDGSYYCSGNSFNTLQIYPFFPENITLLGTILESFNPTDDIFGINWSPDQSIIGLSTSGVTKLRKLQFNEPTDLMLKKQKKELIKIKKLFASTSEVLPTLYESALSTSALLDATLNFSISSLTTVTSFLINGITAASQPSFDWHPTQNLIAISDPNALSLYSYNQISLALTNSIATSQPLVTTNPSWDIKWSPRGDFLINGGWQAYINSFDGYNITQLSSKYDHLFNGIEWDKSGNFIFCCEQRTTPTTTTNDPGQLSAYYFNGTSLTKMTSTGDLEYSTQMSVNYNNHLIAKGGNKGKVNIYAFDPLITNTLSFLQSLNSLSTSCSTVIFHPTQDILFVNTDTQIRAFSINGTFTTELLGCQVSAAGAQFLDFDPTGKYLLVSFSDKFIIFRFDGATLSEVIRYSSGADTLTGAKWSYDGKAIATIVDTGATLFLRLLKPTFVPLTDNKPNLLLETSNAVLAFNTVGASTLVIQNSYALVSLAALNNATSNSIIQPTTLSVSTSNALANLLVQTSRGANALLIPNSQAIVTLASLAIANSFALGPLDIQNSNAIITQKNLTINTSNAISGLLVATSNAVAGLLVRTSNTMAGLLVATSAAVTSLAQKLLPLNTIDIGPSHIHFNSPTITMSYNLLLSTDHQLFVHASGVVNGNGHSITFARGAGTQMTIDPAITTTFQNVIFKDYNDASVVIGAGSSFIFGDDCRVELAEPQTLSRTWSFAGQSLLDGQNNSITLGTGNNFLSSLITSSLTIANANLLNVRDNNIRAANNNAAIIFNNAQIYLSSDFTYSIGSMVINNDVTLRGTSIFNYSTIMGLTIASQSKLTIDQGCTFNYAPAGNFRNLLSFTDSSATLFFNNGSLVATATGPRLINGTLLIDGVMNIQSSAVSTAQAIIFGNGTPANDLIIKLMPAATINLLSGFLNYANAQ
jgi:hypothetical protein